MPNTVAIQSAISGTFPAQYASKVSNLWSNQQGDNVYITATAGQTLIAMAIGLKSLDPFDQLHNSSPSFGYLQGLNDFMPSSPTISDNSVSSPPGGNNWVLATNYNLLDADYTPGSVPPSSPPQYPAATWSLDGYFPSLYIWYVANAAAGTYAINLNSCYENYSTSPAVPAPLGWVAGKPVFDGGVNFFSTAFTWTGGTTTSVDGTAHASGVSSANPAVLPAFTLAGSDLLVAIALQKSANTLGVGTAVIGGDTSLPAYSQFASGKLVGGEAHYAAEWAGITGAGTYTPQFANPLGYETLIAALALKRT